MTESDWLACKDPRPMMEFLRTERNVVRHKWGRRKLRLFGCACLRSIWALLRQPGSRQAVEVAERFADGLASNQELSDAYSAACVARYQETPDLGKGSTFWQAAEAAVHVTARRFSGGNYVSVAHVAPDAANAWAFEQKRAGNRRDHDKLKAEQLSVYADWLRDIFGNPSHPVDFNPSWRSINVLDLARTIHEDRAFERMPILGDALMDEGCENADILEHCRAETTHVRGCWVVDVLLGKM